jgi:THO complex subunit 5
MTVDEIVADPELATVLAASRDTRVQALNLVDQIAAAGPTDTASTEAQLETSKQQKLLITNLAQLRGLHRAANFAARQTKAQTSEARQEVDRLHLQLQNLYYEQRHLQGEIAACESYESVPTALVSTPDHHIQEQVQEKGMPVVPAPIVSRKPTIASQDSEGKRNIARTVATRPLPTPTYLDTIHSAYGYSVTQLAQELIEFRNSHSYQQLPLIPVEEFLALKPEHAADDENALMVARIEHERSEREALEQKRMELLKRKQKLIADNKRRKDDLSNLDKELEKFIDVSPSIRRLHLAVSLQGGTVCETDHQAI